MRRLLSLLAIAVSMPAQQAPQVQMTQSQSVPSGSVSGHIVCADTHAPARFARVSLSRLRDAGSDIRQVGVIFSGGGGQMTTDLDGFFAISHVAPGTYALRVDLPGYLDPMSSVDLQDWMSSDPQKQDRLRSSLSTVTVNGSETANVDVSLERGAAISGKVLFDDGSPAAGVTMHVIDASIVSLPGAGNRGPGRMLPGRLYNTDDHGAFRILSLPPGEYLVATSVSIQRAVIGSVGGSLTRTISNPQTVYAPGSFRKKSADIIKVSGTDEKSGITITIPTRGMHFVAGTVIQQANGMPVSGGNVQMVDADDPTFMLNGQIAPDGSFRIDFVAAGQYTLRVTSAFDMPERNHQNGGFSGSERVSHYYGTTEQTLIVASGDSTGITLQVPALDDPTKPPRFMAPVRAAANPK
ncbi:MSCRAMM family protein [Terriglobus albidus]|nr:carboxypeptidase regulatory-like domain-containing protein [Terriglobus albidus]